MIVRVQFFLIYITLLVCSITCQRVRYRGCPSHPDSRYIHDYEPDYYNEMPDAHYSEQSADEYVPRSRGSDDYYYEEYEEEPIPEEYPPSREPTDEEQEQDYPDYYEEDLPPPPPHPPSRYRTRPHVFNYPNNC